jgi:hypothetical protein
VGESHTDIVAQFAPRVKYRTTDPNNSGTTPMPQNEIATPTR